MKNLVKIFNKVSSSMRWFRIKGKKDGYVLVRRINCFDEVEQIYVPKNSRQAIG